MLHFEKSLSIKLAHLIAVIIVASLHQTATLAESYDEVEKAQNLIEQDQFDAAMTCLDSLIHKEPKNARAFNERAVANIKVGKYAKALEDSNRAIALAPNLAIAYANRAIVYAETNRFQKALDDCDKSIALNPKLAQGYATKAFVLTHLKHYKRALEYCDKAIAMQPESAKFHFNRAVVLGMQGRHKRVLEECNKALSFARPGQKHLRRNIYMERGSALYRMGKFKDVVQDCSAVLAMSPPSSQVFSLRADAYEKLGEFQAQIDDLTAAIKVAPKVADLYIRRSQAYYRLFQLQKAIDDCTTLMEMFPAWSYPYTTAATANEEMGFYHKSTELRAKAARLSTKVDAAELFDRAKLYDSLGKFDLAEADRQKAFNAASSDYKLEMQRCRPLDNFNGAVNNRPKDLIAKQLKGVSIVLPFEYDQRRHIGVPVQVNGRHLQLMLDTGCTHSALWTQAMPRLGKTDSVRLESAKADRTKYLDGFFRARNLKLGDLTLSNVAMSITDGIVGHKTIGGFLGGNILENFVVTVDYSKKQITLATSFAEEMSKNAIVVPLIIRHHLPYCSVKLDRKVDAMALIDTGAPGNVSPDSLLKPILPKPLRFNHRLSGPWIGTLKSSTVQVASLVIDSSNFEAQIFEVFPAYEAPDIAESLTLGHNFLSCFKTVTFDYLTRRAIFEPN